MKNQKQIPRSYWIPLLTVAFTILYLVFPTNNSSVDAYYFAASVKYGNELFHPHHLLYNFTFRLFFSLPFFNYNQIEFLHIMKMGNSVIGGICLWLFSILLKKSGQSIKEIFGIILLTGSSFVVMRYATENEVYLFSLAFSLGASVFYQDYLSTRSYPKLLVSGLLASISVLYHQLGIFWWIGLFAGLIIYRYPWKSKLVFFATVIPVILVYSFIVFRLPEYDWSFDGIFLFALRDFLSPGFDKTPGWENFFFTLINFFRSFLQVHGYIFRLIGENILWVFPGLVSILIIVVVFIRKRFSTRKTGQTNHTFFIIYLIILIFYIVFAFFAGGNAEFMVMVPFLGLLLLFSKIKTENRSMILLGIVFLVWNVFYGLVPRNKYNFTNFSMIEFWIRKAPEARFILKNDQHIVSRFYYKSGVESYSQILRSPSSIIRRGDNIEDFQVRLDSYIRQGEQIYTDCIKYPGIMSRQGVLSAGEDDFFFTGYEYEPVDSVKTLFGTFYLHSISGREGH